MNVSCGNYTVGDFNGSGLFNVADIVNAYSYIGHQWPDPALLCECPDDGPIWAVAMDVNSSCSVNIADVVDGYSKLKTGSPELTPCLDCPPPGWHPFRGGDDTPLVAPGLKSKAKMNTNNGGD
jgi:hypothetical protein